MKGLRSFVKNEKRRLLAMALAAVTAFSSISVVPAQAADPSPLPGTIATVADPSTTDRVTGVYGSNTFNAGKITIDKSVSTSGFGALDGVAASNITPGTNNFMVALSQSSQIMGLAEEMAVPVDVVFVLDMSSSMDASTPRKYASMVTAANEAIESLLSTNALNRVAVVGFSNSAQVLSSLAHYDDTNTNKAASEHLIIQDGGDDARDYIKGQTARRRLSSGTNIQAGIALGAQQLLNASDIHVELENGETITRLPFLIVLSDGAATCVSAGTDEWYDASAVNSAGKNSSYNDVVSRGFMAVLTAAYFKGKITEHYFGASASEENRCQIYTIGLEVESSRKAQLTMNPTDEYGTNYYTPDFTAAWNGYTSGSDYILNLNGRQSNLPSGTAWDFSAGTGADNETYKTYTITAESYNATKEYVNGNRVDTSGGTSTVVNMYSGGLKYNDEYFAANSSGLSDTFNELIRLIQIKAISLPTDTTAGSDFSGYVHFYDTIGEYMEVKKVHGIVTDGYVFRGASFAQNMKNWGTASGDADFEAAMRKALEGRVKLAQAGGQTTTVDDIIADLVSHAQNDGDLLYYNSSTDFDNSFSWWGKSYTDAHGDEQMQYLDYAGSDSISTIEAGYPTGATHLCRSYYYYGTAGGQIAPTADALLFVIRVQRSVTAPYQQTVCVSIPGSMLSTTRVLITERLNNQTEAFVQEDTPVRVLYEVGLQSDINAFNVADKLAGTAYVAEETDHKDMGSKDNYDKATDTYYFYTNDWDRAGSQLGHSRAMARAGYDVSEDNEFYTYTEDRLIYTKNGDTYAPVTSKSDLEAGKTYYYARTYYDWSEAGSGTATTAGTIYTDSSQDMQKTAYIPLAFGSTSSIDSLVKEASGQCYIKAGTHTSSALAAFTEVIAKSANNTSTSGDSIHYVKTALGHESSHYSTKLGNNGRLALTADHAAVKTENIDFADAGRTDITDGSGNGTSVTVGDKLTYYITVKNTESSEATLTVTDTVPAGTALVKKASATGTTVSDYEITTDGGVASLSTDTNDVTTITWKFENVAVGGSKTVSFQAEVTEDALTDVSEIVNQANLQVENGPSYTTNVIINPPYGKEVSSLNPAVNIENGVQIGTQLRYAIEYVNDSDAKATVIVTDTIPEGTTLMDGTITENGQYDAATKTITWSIPNVDPDKGGTVEFTVVVDESAKTLVENDAKIQIGTNGPEYKTNPTQTDVLIGDLVISKVVTVDSSYGDASAINNQEFTLTLTTRSAQNDRYNALSDTLVIKTINPAVNGGAAVAGTVTFNDGVATLKIKHGDTITIEDLPAGLEVNVLETTVKGFTPSYKVNGKDAEVALAGAKIAVVTGNTPSKMDITNSYKPGAVEVAITGQKVLNTVSGYLGDTVFDFKLYNVTDNKGTLTVDDATAIGGATATVNSSKTPYDAAFEFAKITYTNPGTHYYAVEEVTSSTIQGVTYDKTRYFVKVKVTDQGGQLTAEWSVSQDNGATWSAAKEDSITFTNTYEPLEVSLNLTAMKALTGRTLEDKGYSFVVMENGAIVATGTNDTTGKVTFTPINFYAPGEHTYQVREVDAGKPNITYDTVVYTVYVKVEDDNGQLKITSYKVDDADAVLGNSVGTFQNYYVPGTISFNLIGTKYYQQGNLTDSSTTPIKLTGGEFNFIVDQMTNNTYSTVKTPGVSTATNSASDTNDANLGAAINFAAINYEPSDAQLADTSYVGETLYYRIKEVKPDLSADAYTNYSNKEWQVAVDVAYNRTTGILSVNSITYDGNANGKADFTNVKYPGSITVTPVGEKETTGSLPTSDIGFSLTVKEVDTNAADNTGKTVATGIAKANKDNPKQDIEFTSLTYTHTDVNPKTYQYWIMESNAGLIVNGVKYDSTRYLMEVTVANTNGRLSATVQYFKVNDSANDGSTNPAHYFETVASTSFENEYAASGYLNLTAKKVLTGADLEKDQFAFRIQRCDKDGNPIAGNVINGVNEKDGTVKFATLYYTSEDESLKFDSLGVFKGYKGHEGLIKYQVSEINLGQPGITYDTKTYDFYVQLTVGTGGVITTELCKEDGTVIKTIENNATEILNINDNSGITFNNSYAVQTGTEAVITAKKTLNGRNMIAGEFTFQLYHVVSDTVKNLVDVSTNAADGTVTFTRHYAANVPTGTYKYEIVELNSGATINGVTYDVDTATQHTVYVTITDDKAEAELKAKVHNEATGDTYTAPVFTNTYTAASVSYTPEAIKNLVGRPLKDQEFAFLIKTWDAASNSSKDVVSTGYNNGTQVVFTDLYYTTADTYKYEISEVHSSLGGIKYDTTKYYMKVKVTDNTTTGQLETEVTYYKDAAFTNAFAAGEVPTFNNTYTVANGAVQLKADKTLEGHVMEAKEFEFVVIDLGEEIVATGENSTAGTNSEVVFGALGYTHAMLVPQRWDAVKEAYKFVYFMKEIIPTGGKANGITYDPSQYKVEVLIKEDGNGVMDIEVAYYGLGDGKTVGSMNPDDYPSEKELAQGTVPSFKNTYIAEATSVGFEAYKDLAGKELKKDEFIFELRDAANTLLATGTNATSNENGLVTFKDTANNVFRAVLDKVGTHTFTISEKNTPNDDEKATGTYTMDDSVYTVTVEVKDDGLGQLYVASKTYSLGGQPVVGAGFINQYMPESITRDLSAHIQASKLLNGKELKEDEFTFEVKDPSGTVVATGTNDEYGIIKFTEFTYTQDGEYRYWITEVVDPAKDYVTYDDSIWEVRVTVGYDYATGELEISDVKTFAFTRAVEATPIFENTYTAKPVSITLTANKILTGRDLKAHEFNFRVLEKNAVSGEYLIIAQSTNEADGSVTLTFTEDAVGTHTYVVDEVIPAQSGNGITYDSHSVEVTVTVVDNGTGQLTIDGTPTYSKGNVTVFENKYAAAPVSVDITAQKTLIGAELTDGAFLFELVDASGNVVATAKNDAAGNIIFNKEYAAIGEYKYVIREVKGTDATITYASNEVAVTVKVEDNLVGNLVAGVSYDQAAVFENTYTPPTLPETDLVYKVYGFTKVWNDNNNAAGKRPDSIIVEAYQSGAYVTDIVLSEENGWFNTAVLMEKNGDIVYEWTIKEKDVPEGYVASYDQATLTVTNTSSDLVPGNVPPTGDHAQPGLWLALVTVSGLGLLGLGLDTKRKKSKFTKNK